jgi:hypothetical protein
MAFLVTIYIIISASGFTKVLLIQFCTGDLVLGFSYYSFWVLGFGSI